jgi:hypothetical protein
MREIRFAAIATVAAVFWNLAGASAAPRAGDRLHLG